MDVLQESPFFTGSQNRDTHCGTVQKLFGIGHSNLKITLDYCALLGADSEEGGGQNVNFIWNDPKSITLN